MYVYTNDIQIKCEFSRKTLTSRKVIAMVLDGFRNDLLCLRFYIYFFG